MAEIVLERGFAAIVRGLHRRHAGELVEVECVVLQRRPSEVDEKRMRYPRHIPGIEDAVRNTCLPLVGG